jgi:hypothetical protein
MRLKPKAYFAIFILLLMIAFIILSLTYVRLEIRLLPIGVSSIVIILTTLILWKEIVPKEKTPRTDAVATIAKKDETPRTTQEQVVQDTKIEGEAQRFGLSLAWIVGFFLCIYLLGFIIAIPIFIAAYLKCQRRGWITSISFAVIITFALYGVFELVLQAGLYRGLLWGLIVR